MIMVTIMITTTATHTIKDLLSDTKCPCSQPRILYQGETCTVIFMSFFFLRFFYTEVNDRKFIPKKKKKFTTRGKRVKYAYVRVYLFNHVRDQVTTSCQKDSFFLLYLSTKSMSPSVNATEGVKAVGKQLP